MTLNLDPNILNTLIGVLTLIMVKTLLAWIIAAKEGKFDVREAPRFIISNVLPYVAGLLVLAGPGIWNPDLLGIFYVGAGVVGVKYLAEIKDKFAELFGVQLPEAK